MIDINKIEDPRKVLENLYERLCGIKSELEKKVEAADYYYPMQETLLDRRELDAVNSIVKYIESYNKE